MTIFIILQKINVCTVHDIIPELFLTLTIVTKNLQLINDLLIKLNKTATVF